MRRKGSLNCMASAPWTARFPYRTYASSTRRPTLSCATKTWNSRRCTTAHRVLPRKPKQALPYTATQKTRLACAAFWTITTSPAESWRYEHFRRPSRCLEGSRLHRRRSALPLHRGDAFGILPGTPIPRFHGRSLGQADDHVLAQTPGAQSCPHRPLSEERRGVSPLLPAALPPDGTREYSQPSRP